MSDPHAPSAAGHGAHAHPSYVKVWAILTVLLIISVSGTLLGLNIPTVVTVGVAFTVALIKAYMIAKYFMHINIEKKYVMYLVGSMVVLMLLLVGAVSPDVMHHDGANWHNQAAADTVKKGMAEVPAEHHPE